MLGGCGLHDHQVTLWAMTPDLAVVGEAADGGEAVEEARRLQPDVLLMDIRMPGLDGIEATRRLVAGGSQARIVTAGAGLHGLEHVLVGPASSR